jgi:hypothetical protein
MKVTTIDGGFRGRKGVGNLSTEQQLTEIDNFEARLSRFRSTRDLVAQRLRAAALPAADSQVIDATMTALEERIDAHIASSSQLRTSADLLAWRAEAGRIVALADAFVQQSRALLQGETAVRPWKVVLALVIGGSIVSAVAWGLARVRY